METEESILSETRRRIATATRHNQASQIRFQLPLATLFLLSIIGILIVAHFVLLARYSNLERQLEHAYNQVTRLALENPNQIAIVELPTSEPNRFVYRVFAKSGLELNVGMIKEKIPQQGVGEDPRTDWLKPPIHDGSFLMVVSQTDVDPTKKLIAVDLGNTGRPQFKLHVDNDDRKRKLVSSDLDEKIGIFSPGQPVVLRRVRHQQLKGSWLDPIEPCDGYLIWMIAR